MGSITEDQFASGPIGLLSSFSGAYGDFTGHLGGGIGDRERIGGRAKDSRRYTLLFGPEVTPVRGDRWKVAAHLLGGVMRTNAAVLQLDKPIPQDDDLIGGPALPPLTSVTFAADNTAAMAIGGSVDVRLAGRLWYRVVQPQWLLTFSPRQDHIRISTGLVFHLGGAD